MATDQILFQFERIAAEFLHLVFDNKQPPVVHLRYKVGEEIAP